MNKILTVNKPLVTSYMTHAPILSILSDNENYLPWFFLNYIQVRIRDDGIDFYHFYTAHYSCPFFDTTYLSRDFISKYIKNELITDFFTKCINDNKYIIVLINTSYIKLYSGDRTDSHPLLIYGYNKNNKTFNVADFFNNGKYTFDVTSFDELELAYKNNDDANHWQKGIHILERIEYNRKYSVKRFIETLKRYLYGYEESIIYNPIPDENIKFGLNALYYKIYEELAKFKNCKTYDDRVLPIFCEHKRMLKMMCEFLSKNGCDELTNLHEDYNTLYEKAFILRNKWIKYTKQQTIELYDENEILKLKEIEINLIGRTIDIMQSVEQEITFNDKQ